VSTTSWGGGGNDRSHKRFKFALLLSVVLHGLVLLIHTGSPNYRKIKT
jgi:hypothetical protein